MGAFGLQIPARKKSSRKEKSVAKPVREERRSVRQREVAYGTSGRADGWRARLLTSWTRTRTNYKLTIFSTELASPARRLLRGAGI